MNGNLAARVVVARVWGLCLCTWGAFSKQNTSGGGRAQNHAGAGGSPVSPPTAKPVTDWQQAARLRTAGVWTDAQYEAWTVEHWGLPL